MLLRTLLSQSLFDDTNADDPNQPGMENIILQTKGCQGKVWYRRTKVDGEAESGRLSLLSTGKNEETSPLTLT